MNAKKVSDRLKFIELFGLNHDKQKVARLKNVGALIQKMKRNEQKYLEAKQKYEERRARWRSRWQSIKR